MAGPINTKPARSAASNRPTNPVLGINDYGVFALMPVVGDLKVDQDARASWFSHKSEEVRPYYYRVYLSDPDVTTEITPTERAAQFRFTYPASDSSYLIIDGFDRGSSVRVLPDQRTVVGYTRFNSGGVPEKLPELLHCGLRSGY